MLPLTTAVSRLPRPSAFAFITARAISALGSSMTGFGLNVWVYQTTGSYRLFASLAVLSAIPGVLLSPVAGVVVDRHSRSRVLVACDLVASAAVLAALAASTAGALSTTVVGAVVVTLALVRTVSWPGASAAVAVLAPGRELPRINGLSEAYDGAVVVLGPLMGGALIGLIKLPGLIAIDLATYAVSIVVVLRLRSALARDNPPPSATAGGQLRRFLGDCLSGFRWIAARKPMARLLAFFAVINLGCSIYVVAYTPYVLSFSSPRTLGTCLSLFGAGMLAGGGIFAVGGGERWWERGVLVGAVAMGVCMTAVGLSRSSASLFASAFLCGLTTPIVNASSQTIWQVQVPTPLVGRVFSVRKMIAWGLNPVAILLSIPAVTFMFGPLLESGVSARAGLPAVWGTGRTGALGLMISTCGLLCAFVACAVLAGGGFGLRAATAVARDASPDVT